MPSSKSHIACRCNAFILHARARVRVCAVEGQRGSIAPAILMQGKQSQLGRCTASIFSTCSICSGCQPYQCVYQPDHVFLSVVEVRCHPYRSSAHLSLKMSHWNAQPHVGINKVACHRTERTTDGSTSDTPNTALIKINLGLKY